MAGSSKCGRESTRPMKTRSPVLHNQIRGDCRLFCRCERRNVVKIEIELKHVDARLAEEAQLPPLGVPRDHLADCILGEMTLAGDASHLELRACRCDVRIEAGCRGSLQAYP